MWRDLRKGNRTLLQDEQGNLLAVEQGRGQESTQQERELWEQREGSRLMEQEHAHDNAGVTATQVDPHDDPNSRPARETLRPQPQPPQLPGSRWRQGTTTIQNMGTLTGLRKRVSNEGGPSKLPQPKEKKQGPARAYQFGNTIIVEDENGEVVKKYYIPSPSEQNTTNQTEKSRERVGKMGRYLGRAHTIAATDGTNSTNSARKAPDIRNKKPLVHDEDDGDNRLRFTISSIGQRMSKKEFIDKIRHMNSKARVRIVKESDVPETVKREVCRAGTAGAGVSVGAGETGGGESSAVISYDQDPPFSTSRRADAEQERLTQQPRKQENPKAPTGPSLPPLHVNENETDEAEDPESDVPPTRQPSTIARETLSAETAPEKRGREGALGISSRSAESDGDSEAEEGNVEAKKAEQG